MSQDGIIRHLGLQNEIGRDYISKFERGVLEPTLNVLLAYAGAISAKRRGDFLEAFIDDAMDLPREVTADSHHQRSILSSRQISSRKKKTRS
jgi:transcriptional regulator with XRE-family HTH domain